MKDVPITESLITEPISKLASSASEVFAEATSPSTRRAVKRKVAKIKRRAAEFYDDARDTTRVALRRADHEVRRHPYQSILLGAGVGILLGYLLSRRSTD